MIWLKVKQLFWDMLVHFLPGMWIVNYPDNSWRYRLVMRVYVESYAIEYEIYEYNLPLRVTPLPGDYGDPF